MGSPPHGLAQKLAPLIFADSSPALEAALQRLDFGASPLSDLERLVRFFNDHVLVVVGPQAKKFWRRENVEGEDEQLHTQAWCASCETFCLHASCEHTHAAFLHLEHISMQVPVFPERQARTPLFQQQPVQQLILPTQRRQVTAQSRVPISLPPFSGPSLANFIRAYDLHLWGPLFHKQQTSAHQISSLPVADLIAIFPAIPAGVLCKIQSAAQEWLSKASWCRVFDLTLAFARCRMTTLLLPTLRHGLYFLILFAHVRFPRQDLDTAEGTPQAG